MTKKKNGLWSEEKAKELFRFIEEQKKNNVPLIQAFQLFAKNTDRKQNSVRNYYYFHLRHLEKHPDEAKKLGVSLKVHTKTLSEKFTKEEERKLMEDIIALRKQGKSVRKACLILANNDISEMIRLQNKVRQLFKKKLLTNDSTKVIQMPKKTNVVSDEEISSLFVGLMKMVQRNAYNLAESKVAVEKQTIQKKLEEVSQSALEKEKQIQRLKQENGALRSQVSPSKSVRRENKLNNIFKETELNHETATK